MARQLGVAIGGGGRQQAGAEGKAESCTGAYIGHTCVRHHWAIAIAATPTSCFALEVQCQCPAAPRLPDFCLYLGEIDGWRSGMPLTLVPCVLPDTIPAVNDYCKHQGQVKSHGSSEHRQLSVDSRQQIEPEPKAQMVQRWLSPQTEWDQGDSLLCHTWRSPHTPL